MSMSNERNFYKNLPILDSFFDASKIGNYHALPNDWFLAVTDIVNSTAAIENGHYKRVNILGVSPIIGILNKIGRQEIPFVFTGDGAAFCIPPDLIKETKKVIADSIKIGQTEYDLDLRAAIFPLSYIRQHGYEINVARYRVSDVYLQAVFSGGGISHAETLLKNSEASRFKIYASDGNNPTDYTGLECRWQEVNQQGREIITLLVKSNPRLKHSTLIYEEVLKEMRNIFGFDDKTNPITASELSMNMSVFKLLNEVKFRTFGLSWAQRLLYLLKAELQIIMGKILMPLNIKTSETDWSLYKSDLARNSDHRKFDDMLRIVLSGNNIQRRMLEEYLQKKFEESLLAYGLHISDSAMVTCMVFNYQREHIHFIDGNEGGYVKASKELKRRIQDLEQKETKI